MDIPPLAPAGVLELLVVQATPFCNVDCSYCYLPDRSSKARMSDATLQRLFNGLLSSPLPSDDLTILWHAGEPLVPGVDYYQRAITVIQEANRRGLRISHSFQTNGTLIDQAWCDFFKTNGVNVGVSLDGPRHLHDRHRKTRNGRGTFDSVMRGVSLLQTNEVPFHVITVLTRDSLGCARELYDFYRESGITRVGFNIEEIEGDHHISSLQDSSITFEVRSFFSDLFALVERDPSKLEVREFSGALDIILNPQRDCYGNPQAEALRIVSVGVNGDISTFSPELLGYSREPYGSFVFGNVHDDDVLSFLSSPKLRRVDADIQSGVERCRKNCEYFELCLGGAPANKLFENGSFDSGETMYCRLSKKAVIDVVLDGVEREYAEPAAA